jgi:hypothetical protein
VTVSHLNLISEKFDDDDDDDDNNNNNVHFLFIYVVFNNSHRAVPDTINKGQQAGHK